jgi:hypothetical protein
MPLPVRLRDPEYCCEQVAGVEVAFGEGVLLEAVQRDGDQHVDALLLEQQDAEVFDVHGADWLVAQLVDGLDQPGRVGWWVAPAAVLDLLERERFVDVRTGPHSSSCQLSWRVLEGCCPRGNPLLTVVEQPFGLGQLGLDGGTSGDSRELLSWRFSRLISFARPFWASLTSVTWSQGVLRATTSPCDRRSWRARGRSPTAPTVIVPPTPVASRVDRFLRGRDLHPAARPRVPPPVRANVLPRPGRFSLWGTDKARSGAW